MASHGSDLAVRRHERYLCDLAASVSVEGPGVRLSRGALGAHGRLPARVVDLSSGGMGLSAKVYLPPSSLILIVVTLPDGAERTLRAMARVHRTGMTDRQPTYYIGTAFEGSDQALAAAVEGLLGSLRASGAQLVPERARA